MTHQPEDRQPEEPRNGSSDVEPERGFDEDAAWAEIVANYGDRPEMGPESPPFEDFRTDPEEKRRKRSRNIFDRSYIEANTEDLNTEATWDDEGHFVPPPPPPLPALEPRRKLAWIGLFGAPLLMLLAVVFGWQYPTWFSAMLVAAFVGGFVYLVATMTRRRPGDWSGDDGAVV